MNGRITPLPHWVLTNYQSAFYDSESGTVLQALARIYPKVEEIITDYNDYVKQLDSYITDFANGLIKDFDCFKNCIIKTMTDYIETIDTKMSVQDTFIADKFNEITNRKLYTISNVYTRDMIYLRRQVFDYYDYEMDRWYKDEVYQTNNILAENWNENTKHLNHQDFADAPGSDAGK